MADQLWLPGEIGVQLDERKRYRVAFDPCPPLSKAKGKHFSQNGILSDFKKSLKVTWKLSH